MTVTAEGVKDGKSLTDKDGKPLPGQGEDHVLPDGRTVGNVLAENRRKSEELTTITKEKEEMEERLDELEEKVRLTREEREEVVQLRGDIKAAAKELRMKEGSAPWIQIAKEEAEEMGKKTSLQAILDFEIERANDYVEDKAFDLSMDTKVLAKALTPFAIKYNDKRPERRNQLAFRDWQKEQTRMKEIDDKEKKLKAEENERLSWREGTGRSDRTKTQKQKFEDLERPSDRASAVVDLINSARQAASR